MLNQIDMYNLISLIISLLALIVAIYSVIKSNKINQYEILIEDPSFETIDNKKRVMFSIYNNSMKSIKIHSIQFFTLNNIQLFPISFDISAYYKEQDLLKYKNIKPSGPLGTTSLADVLVPTYVHSYEYESNIKDFIVSPYKSDNITLYFEDFPEDINIKLNTNQRFDFSVKPSYSQSDLFNLIKIIKFIIKLSTKKINIPIVISLLLSAVDNCSAIISL